MNDEDSSTDYDSSDDMMESSGLLSAGPAIEVAALLLLVQQWRVASIAVRIFDNILDNCYDGRTERSDYTVNRLAPKRDRLNYILGGHASMFRNFTGFYAHEWQALCDCVLPILESRARQSRQRRGFGGRPTKLNPEERLLSAILMLRGVRGCREEGIDWNASKTCLNDDFHFVIEVLCEALADEIAWPSAEERAALANVLPGLSGCIGHVDGTLCKILKPRIADHKRYYNNRKKMYCINTVVVIDHSGMIIYFEGGFAGSFHDIRCLRNCDLYQNWRNYFTVDEDVGIGEYFLGDPGYMGAEMFVLRRVDNREMPAHVDQAVFDAFNRRHAGERVRVEWGIGGIKNKWRRFLKTFPNRRWTFELSFKAAALLTNFIHRRRMIYGVELVGQVPRAQLNFAHEHQVEWG